MEHGAGDLQRGLKHELRSQAWYLRGKADMLKDLTTFPMQVVEHGEALTRGEHVMKRSARKPASPLSTPPRPFVEILPQPLKQVKHHYRCCMCDDYFPSTRDDPQAMVPVCYLVTPATHGAAHREEIGRLCEGRCLPFVREDDVEDFRNRINGWIYVLHERIKRLSFFVNHPVTIPPEHVWATVAAEKIANSRQELGDLAAATGLAREEIVRRLIARAAPEDL